MSDKATMLRETDEALAELRAVFDGLTEEQARRVWLGVSAVRNSLLPIPQRSVQNCDSRPLEATKSIRVARELWAPGSFWALRYPGQRTVEGAHHDPA